LICHSNAEEDSHIIEGGLHLLEAMPAALAVSEEDLKYPDDDDEELP